MTKGNLAEKATSVIGDAAGTVVDPRQGLQQGREKLRGKANAPMVIGLGLGIVVGYLIGRRMPR